MLIETFFLSLIYIFGFIFVFSSLDKLINRKKHLAYINAYNLVPRKLELPLLIILGLIELFVSSSFFLLKINALNVYLAITLLTIFSIAIYVNIRRGNRNISCGCGGILENNHLNYGLVFRNVIMIFLLYLIHSININLDFDFFTNIFMAIYVLSIILIWLIGKEMYLVTKKMKLINKYFL